MKLQCRRSPKKQFKRTGEKMIKKMNEAYFNMKEQKDPQHIICGPERKSGCITGGTKINCYYRSPSTV